jgi:carboxyl-terminal processing protease
VEKSSIRIAPICLAALSLLATGVALADGSQPPSTASVPAPPMPADLARRVQDVADVVLEHHIDPPARQQMILSGIKGLYRAAGLPVPPGLGRRVSAIATPEPLAALLKEVWPAMTAEPRSADKLERALLEGVLAPVPGGAELLTAKERNAAEQLAGNRYVGILVSLGTDDKEKRPTFVQVMEGGPAQRAGVKSGDVLEEVEGVDTKGMPLRDVVERTRGDEGTAVTIKVRTPKEAASRTLKITRERISGRLLTPTVLGMGQGPASDGKVRLDGPDPIGYIRINAITASTPHELRKRAREMEGQGLRALVLDLRGSGGRESDVHPAVLLADSLLERGAIGRVRTVRGETTYRAESDALFRGWPIAVLVDQGTSGTAEWLVAALQDNHWAVVVGSPTAGAYRMEPIDGLVMAYSREGTFEYEATVRTTIPVGDGRWSVAMVTGYLERGDGRPLADLSGAAPDASASREPSRGGVQPDHMIPSARRRPDAIGGPNSLRRWPAKKAEAPSKPADKPGTAPDPILDAARQVLHKALNP